VQWPPRIGAYDIVGRLAIGGMAEILLGRKLGPEGFDRAVVVKRILPQLAVQPAFVEMFLDEGRIGMQIRHPNVVEIYELGQEADSLFLIMEYLEGENLASVVRRSVARGVAVPQELGAAIVAQACAGLHAAHELRDDRDRPRGLVHRDISPQNLFVTYDGGVKVLDFGIARAAGRLTHTRTGQVKGKFAYMSPEQCLGAPLDPRSDIFALGAVLFEVTTSRGLFVRPAELAILKAITEDPIPRPSAVVDDYPPRLEAICLRALARRREDRYQSAAEMRRDLLDAARELGVTEEPAGRLAGLMRGLFAERIAEKLLLREQLRTGDAVSVLPAPDVDPAVEPLSALEAMTQRAAPGRAGRSAERARWRLRKRAAALALGAILVVATGALVWGLGSARSPAPAVVAGPSVASAPILVAPDSSTRAADVGGTPAPDVAITIESTPPGAVVTLDGVTRGRTPVVVRAARGSRPLAVVVRLPEHQSLSRTVVPDVDQRLHLALVRVPRPGRPGPRPPRARPTPSRPSEPGDFRRFE
jgi:serine/threonine-protein kinase